MIMYDFHVEATFFTGIGKRTKNEDALYPESSDLNTKAFVICDGVGGNKFGEVASRLVAESMFNYINIYNDLEYAYNLSSLELKNYSDKFPNTLGMSTTMATFYIGKSFCEIGWIGDSRVYMVRNGKILYQSSDHSLINKLISEGRLTKEQAKNSPLKKYIVRSISSNNKIGCCLEKVMIQDVQINDFILLCTDGFLESVSNSMIEKLLLIDNDLEYIKNSLLDICRSNSIDNYSMYLIKIVK